MNAWKFNTKNAAKPVEHNFFCSLAFILSVCDISGGVEFIN